MPATALPCLPSARIASPAKTMGLASSAFSKASALTISIRSAADLSAEEYRLLIARAETAQGAGRLEEALAAYRQALATGTVDETTPKLHYIIRQAQLALGPPAPARGPHPAG